jgi:Ca-activated chloride channel family protein
MLNIFTNLHLLRPWWLLALLPGALLWWHLRRSTDPLKMYHGAIAPHLLKHLVIGETKQGLFHPLRLFPLAWLLLVIALAGPSWRTEPSPFAEQQAGLIVLLKASSSMKAQDLPPTRLERAVYKLHDLFAVRGPEPSGLIAYSGSAHLVMPLTNDTRIIEQIAGELSPDIMPIDGDRLVDALALAREQFDRGQTTGSILIITDSIDETQAQALGAYRKETNLPIQVLAVGAESQTARAAVAQGARALDATVHTLTADNGDVRDIVAGAKRMVKEVSTRQAGSRPRDEGYWLVPLIALMIALWARRGWSLKWH